jgi:putative hydrolase of the HAD superfamily
MIRAITFDFWNTLYKGFNREGIFAGKMLEMSKVLQPWGLNPSVLGEAFKAAWRKTQTMQRSCGRDPGPEGQLQFALEELNLQIDGAVRDDLYQIYTRLDTPPRLNDDVEATLPVLTENFRLALICNTGITPGIILRELMKKDNILDYFALTVFSDEIGWAKPNTEIFNYTLKHLGVNNNEAAHVGDDEITDIMGAKKAGMKTVWLAPERETDELADYHIQRIREITDIFIPGRG